MSGLSMMIVSVVRCKLFMCLWCCVVVVCVVVDVCMCGGRLVLGFDKDDIVCFVM